MPRTQATPYSVEYRVSRFSSPVLTIHGYGTREEACDTAARFALSAERDPSAPAGLVISVIQQLYDGEGTATDVRVIRQYPVGSPPREDRLSLARAVCFALVAAALLVLFILATGGAR